MKFDSKTIFSIFISVIMIGSIVGFTAFYSFPDQDQNSDNGNDPVLPPTAINFVAENIEVKVDQMLPTMRIQAETSETDLTAINSSIYAIEGIKRVNAGFEQSPYTLLEKGYVYVAEVSFDNDLNLSFVIEKLKEKTSLEYLDGYTFALVELPSTIEMQSENSDLGLFQTYEFSENITEALVGFDTMEGDQLTVSVTATFIGNDATNIMAFEEANLTAAPLQKSIMLEAEIASLENILFFEAVLPYTLLDSLFSLEEEIIAIADVNSASIYMSEAEAKLSINGEEIEETKFSEFEIFLNDINAGSVSIENQPLKAEVYFEEISSNSFSEKKVLIKEKLEELEIEADVEEITDLISGQVQIESNDSTQAALSLLSLLESKGLSAELIQAGDLVIQELPDPDDSEISYPIETGFVQSNFKTGHSIGDLVNASVDYILVRGIVQSAQATEE